MSLKFSWLSKSKAATAGMYAYWSTRSFPNLHATLGRQKKKLAWWTTIFLCCTHRSIAIYFLQKQLASRKNNPWKSKPIWPFRAQSKARHNMPSYNSDSSDRPQTLPTPAWVVYLARVAWTSPAKRPSTIQTCCCSARTPLEISGKQISIHNIEPNLYTPCIDRCTRKIFMHMVFRRIYDRQAITKRNLDNSVNI